MNEKKKMQQEINITKKEFEEKVKKLYEDNQVLYKEN